MAKEPPRSPQQRKHDPLARLEHDHDAWVASADQDGNAYLVPLFCLWDGTALTISTPAALRVAAVSQEPPIVTQ